MQAVNSRQLVQAEGRIRWKLFRLRGGRIQATFQTKAGMDVSCLNHEEWMSVVHHEGRGVHGGGGQCLGRGRNACWLFTMTARNVVNF
jgi:hypothetical protein